MPITTMPNTNPVSLEAGKYYRLRNMKTKLYVIGKEETGTFFLCSTNGNYINYFPNGKKQSISVKHPSDAIMEWRELARVQLMGYQLIYSDHSRSPEYSTKQLALENADPNKTLIACIDLQREVIEGEGLNE